MTRLRCQRIGCNATFTEDVNPEGSCTYHDSGPLFHDGMKEWSCCKKRSHDFSLFLEIPGCKTGRHTIEKPVLSKPAPKIATITPLRPSSLATNISVSEACSRCKQGFFCSDHGSVVRNMKQESANTAQVPSTGLPKKIIGINEPQVCKNQGCGHTFKEKDNHDTACNYHPGQAVFHDRIRGWKCCDIHVKEFDEFMSIPPCTKGWHNPDPTP